MKYALALPCFNSVPRRRQQLHVVFRIDDGLPDDAYMAFCYAWFALATELTMYRWRPLEIR